MSSVFNAGNAASLQALQHSSRLFENSRKAIATGVVIASAADDATRYTMSSQLRSRSHLIESLNNGISIAMRTLETAEQSLQQMVSLLDQGSELVTKAQSNGTPRFQGTRTTTDISDGTLVSALAVAGSRFTIASDGGKSFTYTFGASAATTRWGEIVNALNLANIGVIAEYIPGTAPSISNLKFRSTNGLDFRFGGDSDRNVITALGAITSGTGGALNLANQFVLGAAAPTAAHTGFTVSYGGAVQSTVNVTAATAIAAGSTLAFSDLAGNNRTWTASAATTVGDFINSVNGGSLGVVAELANSGAGTTVLRLRNRDGEDLRIVNGSGAFAPGGTVPFAATLNSFPTGYAVRDPAADHTFRLTHGVAYDNIIATIDAIATNNPAPGGRNLLRDGNLALLLDGVSNMFYVDGFVVSAAGTLGLTQAGSTWTTFDNTLTSGSQINNARRILLDRQASLGQYRTFLAERYALNRDFFTGMKALGDELVGADIAEESARLTAIQTQQQAAVEALSAGSRQAQSLLQLLG